MKLKTQKHPTQDLEIRFNEEKHQYHDSKGIRYQGVTTLIHSWFEKFDSLGLATKCSQNKKKKEYFGRKPEEIMAEWKKNAKESADFGTDLHKFAEYLLESPENTRFVWGPDDNRIKQAKTTLAQFIDDNLLGEYEIISPEFLIFSPSLRIATMVDVLARHKKDGHILIGDWKTNKKIDKKAFFNAGTGEYKMGLNELDFVQDCNYQHYGLQVNLCQEILVRESYFPKDTKFVKKIYHLKEDKRKKLDKFSIVEYTIRDKKKAMEIITYMKSKEHNTEEKGMGDSADYRIEQMASGRRPCGKINNKKEVSVGNIPGEETKGTLSFAEINKYIFGDSKVGKSLLASSMYIDKKRPYFITTEDNHSHLDVVAQRVTSWEGFMKLLKILEDNSAEMRSKYSCIVVDVVSDIADMLKKDICKSNGIKDLGDLGFGKGWTMEKDAWKDATRRLMIILPVLFIDHSKSSVQKEDNEEYTKVIPLLPERLYKFISGKTPIIGAILQDKEGTYLDCTPSRELAAGSHFDALIGKKFRLEFSKITKVFKELRECIEKKGGK